MNQMLETVSTIALAIIGLAIVAVLVSQKANTTGVVQALSSGLANNIGVASAPVTGASLSLTTAYPSGGYGSGFGF